MMRGRDLVRVLADNSGLADAPRVNTLVAFGTQREGIIVSMRLR